MRHQLSHGDRRLAVLGELRPVARDRFIDVDPSARMGDRDRRRGHPLGGGEHGDQRVALPRQLLDPVAVAAPQIDHLVAVAVERAGRTDLAPFEEVPTERVRDGAVSLIDLSADQIGRYVDLQHLGHLPGTSAVMSTVITSGRLLFPYSVMTSPVVGRRADVGGGGGGGGGRSRCWSRWPALVRRISSPLRMAGGRWSVAAAHGWSVSTCAERLARDGFVTSIPR
ncbi:hypothetical protein BH23ACT3_BH23ACT3_19610 [soil metagenome]